MEVTLLKTIKYKGKYCKLGETLKIDKDDIKEFKHRNIISDDVEEPVEPVKDYKETYTEEEIRGMTNAEAIKMLKSKEIDVPSNATKDEIVESALAGGVVVQDELEE